MHFSGFLRPIPESAIDDFRITGTPLKQAQLFQAVQQLIAERERVQMHLGVRSLASDGVGWVSDSSYVTISGNLVL